MTSDRENQWRDLAGEWLRLLERIRRYEADNGRPPNADIPELAAAIQVAGMTYPEAIQAALRAIGRPSTAERIFVEIQRRQFINGPPRMATVVENLPRMTKKGLVRKVDKDGPLERWESIPWHAEEPARLRAVE